MYEKVFFECWATKKREEEENVNGSTIPFYESVCVCE